MTHHLYGLKFQRFLHLCGYKWKCAHEVVGISVLFKAFTCMAKNFRLWCV